MGLPPAGGCDGRGRISVVGHLRLPSPEHSCKFYRNQAYYGPVSGGRAKTGIKGDQAVVGSEWIGCGGDTDGGLGGGTNGGGGGDEQDRDSDRLSRWEDNVSHITLGTDTNSPLTYALGLEHHHPIMINLRDPGGRLYI